MLRFRVMFFVALAVLALTTPAKADVVFLLTYADAGAGLGAGPWGTVTLHQEALNIVEVSLNIVSDFSLRSAPDPNHHTVVFSIDGNPTDVTASDISSGARAPVIWTPDGPATIKDAPFGNFAMDFVCTPSCQSSPYTNWVSFDLHSSGLTLSDFVGNTNGYYFAADVQGVNSGATTFGKTGNVAAKGPVVTIPDGGVTLMLLGGALVGLETLRRRFRA